MEGRGEINLAEIDHHPSFTDMKREEEDSEAEGQSGEWLQLLLKSLKCTHLCQKLALS